MNTLKTVKIVTPNGKPIEKPFRVNNVQDLHYITGYIKYTIDTLCVEKPPVAKVVKE